MNASQELFSNLEIAVVDDNLVLLDLISSNLNYFGFSRISSFCRGAEFISCIESGKKYHIVILDLNMPEMDGIEIIRKLASNSFEGAVLLCSGENSNLLKAAGRLTDIQKLKLLGSLEKPFNADQLHSALVRYTPPALAKERPEATTYIDISVLQDAITNNLITSYFQPKIRMGDFKLVSAEVLSRWHHPVLGVISPADFIKLAEQNSLISDLTWMICEQSLSKLSTWRTLYPELSLAINLSPASLNCLDLPEKLSAIAEKYRLPCNAVKLEITESILIHNDAALDVLLRLRLKGFELSIDDFGTGYASLAQLQNIPFTELKIDRIFVHKANESASTRAILESSVLMAKKIGMSVVAEGVETAADWEYAKMAGCDFAQGYYIAKAMSADVFSAWQCKWNNKI